MGVHRLETLLNKGNHLIKDLPLADIMKLYSETHGIPPVVLIDCRSLWGWMFSDTSLFDCSWEALREKVSFVVSAFRDLGCKVEAYASGRANDAHYFSLILSKLKMFVWIYDAIKNDNYNAEVINENGKFYEYNLFSRIVFGDFCKVHASLAESERSIMAHAKQNKVFAIVAEDTDLLVYDCAEYYFPMSKIDFQRKTVDLYDTRSLCGHLKINPEHFPIFCSCMGNEIMRRSYIKGENKHLVIADVLTAYQKKSLEELMENLPSLSLQIFRRRDVLPYLKRSILMYTKMKSDEPDIPVLKNNWDTILAVSIDMCLDVVCLPDWYAVLKRRQFTSRITFEDYSNEDLADNAGLFRELRSRVYAYAFFESGDSSPVLEISLMGGPACRDIPVDIGKPRVSFPGLLALWNRLDESLNETRWKIFADIVSRKMDHRQLMTLPEDLVVPVSIMYYLRNEVRSGFISDREIMTLLFHRHLQDELKLCSAAKTPLDLRAMELFCTFISGHQSMAMAVVASGYPIDIRMLVPMRYNAKIFNDVHDHVSKNDLPIIEHFTEDMLKVQNLLGIK